MLPVLSHNHALIFNQIFSWPTCPNTQLLFIPPALLQVPGDPPLDPPPVMDAQVPRQNNRRLGLSDFTFLQVLGKGSFGKVGWCLGGVAVVWGWLGSV